MRRQASTIAALLAALLQAPPAAAQQRDGAPPDLYQDALQSISEGRKADAFDTLREVTEESPRHAGAWLELALIHCELGNEAEAERMFATIETRFNPPRGILELIAAAREQGCKRWRRNTSASFSAGRGIDQNVNQGASLGTYLLDGPNGPIETELTPEFRPRHDQYTHVGADYQTDLSANGTRGFVDAHVRRNDQLHDYDTTSLFAGIETPWRFGSWRLHTSAMAGGVSLGGRLYQRQAQLQARLDLPVPAAGPRAALIANVTRSNYLTLQNFDSNTFELRGQLSHESATGSAIASLGLLTDRGGALRPGGTRQGALASVRGRHRLGESLDGELSFTRQDWRGASAYSPGLINEVRHQSTAVWRAALTYALSPEQRLLLEARDVHNRENITIFQYNERLLQLSWQRQWR
jgi:hypothetical protein